MTRYSNGMPNYVSHTDLETARLIIKTFEFEQIISHSEARSYAHIKFLKYLKKNPICTSTEMEENLRLS